MSSHSVAEAKERLPELVERALRGEPVVITRDGRPVAELRAVEETAERGPGRTLAGSIAWLRQHRVGRLHDGAPDAARLVGQMRDEEWD